MLRSGFLAWTRRAAALSTRLATSSLSGKTSLTTRRLCADASPPSVAAQRPEPVSVEYAVRREASSAKTDRVGQVGTPQQPVHVRQPLSSEPTMKRTIFVSQFPDSTTAQDLEKIFKDFDSGAEVDPIVRNPHKQAYTFVRLSSTDIVQDVIKKAGGTKIGGVELIVNRRSPKGPSTDHRSANQDRSLYITFTSGAGPALPPPTVEEISAFFHEVDPEVTVPVWRKCGYAFVEFTTRDLAIQARNELRDKETRTGLGVKMRLRFGDNQVPRLEGKQNILDSSNRTVFVGNVPYALDKNSVSRHFETVGTVSLVTMPLPMKTFSRDQNGLRNAGYCFVTFDSQEAAQEAIQKLNGSALGGQVLDVAPRKGPNFQSESQTEEHTSNQNSEVYVCGLSLNLSTDEMKSFFEEVGQVVRVRGPIASPTECVSGEEQALHPTGYGFVMFTTEAAAAAAVSMLDGRNLADHVITVRQRLVPGSADKRAQGSNVESGQEDRNEESGHGVQTARQRKSSVHANMPYDDLLGEQDQRHVHGNLCADGLPPAPDQRGLISKISWSNESNESGNVQAQQYSNEGRLHHGHDERSVYVMGLNFLCKEEELREFVTQRAEGVAKCTITKEQEPGSDIMQSKALGILLFNTKKQAAAAVPLLDGLEFNGINLQVHIRARSPKDSSKTKQQLPEMDSANQVFVGNVPFEATRDQLRQEFMREGFSVIRISMPIDTLRRPDVSVKERSRGFAFVTLSTIDEAVRAEEVMNGHVMMSRHLYVSQRKDNSDAKDTKWPLEAGRQEWTPEELLIEKQKRQKEIDSRTVYCSRFKLDTPQESLHERFELCGEIDNFFFPSVLTNTPEGLKKLSKGFAFITYKSRESVERALELDGFMHDGLKLMVKVKTKPDEQATEDVPMPTKRTFGGTRGAQGGLDLNALKEQFLREERMEEKLQASKRAADAVVAKLGDAGDATSASRGKQQEAPEEQEEEEELELELEAAAPEPPASNKVEIVPQPKRSGRQSKQRQEADAKLVQVNQDMTVKSLSDATGVRVVDVIKCLIRLGEAPKQITNTVSMDAAEMVVAEFNMVAVLPEGTESRKLGRTFSDQEFAQLPSRSPIVTIMGHVDHGKTSLLDYLRNSQVAAGEAGGITQSIAAFEVERPGLGRICFVDTPGHQAFSAMRERGARATDMVVLVVSAVDGVQPQTVEVIQHARAAQVPLIIAVNKCDMPQARPQNVLTGLASEGVVVEEFGGDVQAVMVSARTGSNIDKLEEAILLLAGMMDLRAPTDGPGEGFVVEARKDKAMGPIASIIVTLGELKVGDHVVVGGEWGRVRALRDWNRQPTERVGPSCVCEVMGFRGQPAAGEDLYVVESEKVAVAHAERIAARRARTAATSSATPASGGRNNAEDDSKIKEFPIIVKADVAGSLEALVGALAALPSKEVLCKIVLAEIGAVTEYDVDMAKASGAHIFTFNLRDPTAAVEKLAKSCKVEMFSTKVIYTLLEEVENKMISLLTPKVEIETLGRAEVLQVFEIKGKGGTSNILVAGCKVKKGTLKASTHVQVFRGGDMIHEGQLESLRHHKDIVKEVNENQECGVVLAKFDDYEAGDEMVCINKVTIQRTSL